MRYTYVTTKNIAPANTQHCRYQGICRDRGRGAIRAESETCQADRMEDGSPSHHPDMLTRGILTHGKNIYTKGGTVEIPRTWAVIYEITRIERAKFVGNGWTNRRYKCTQMHVIIP